MRRLDGIPLAIELGAGRLSSFALDDLRDRLDRSLDLLAARRPSGDARHRTLRATLEWSYQLLDEDERRLFRHLSVFVDGVDLDTAEAFAIHLDPEREPAGALARLVDASMVQADFEDRTRYRMLETLRAFGLDRLAAAGEEEGAAERMVRWAVDLAAQICTTLLTEDEPAADVALRRELPNLRVAWRLARARGRSTRPLRSSSRCTTRSPTAISPSCGTGAEELAGDPAIADHPRATAVLGIAAEAAYHRGDYARAERLARRGLERSADPADAWYCLLLLSVVDLARGAYADAITHAMTATEQATDPREIPGIAALATVYAGGDPDTARDLNARGLVHAVSPTMRAWGAYVAGEIESFAGNAALAEQRYLQAIDLARTSGATFLVGVAMVGLPAVRAKAERVEDALRGYRDVIELLRAYRELDPPVDDLAQPRRPPATARRRGTGGADRHCGRPGPGCSRGQRSSRNGAGRRRAGHDPGRGARGGQAGHRTEPGGIPPVAQSCVDDGRGS